VRLRGDRQILHGEECFARRIDPLPDDHQCVMPAAIGRDADLPVVARDRPARYFEMVAETDVEVARVKV